MQSIKFIQNYIKHGHKIIQKCTESGITLSKHDFETLINDTTFTFERTVLQQPFHK